MVLAGHDLAAVFSRAEHFRVDLAEHPIGLDGVVVPVTASIGLAEHDPAVHANNDALDHAAGSAVYRAKAGGRSRVRREQPANDAATRGQEARLR